MIASGVTTGLSQGGGNLAEGGQLATVGRPLVNTQKNSWEIIVNPDGIRMCLLAKISKTPRKTQKTTTYWKPKKY